MHPRADTTSRVRCVRSQVDAAHAGVHLIVVDTSQNDMMTIGDVELMPMDMRVHLRDAGISVLRL